MTDYEKFLESLNAVEKWEDLTEDNIITLKSEAGLRGLNRDVVDKIDRLALLRCLFHHCDNRDEWMKKAEKLIRVCESVEFCIRTDYKTEVSDENIRRVYTEVVNVLAENYSQIGLTMKEFLFGGKCD